MKSKLSLQLLLILIIPVFLSSCLKDFDGRTPQDEYNELTYYLEKNNIEVEQKWNGLYYIETDSGSGPLAEFYDTVIFKYSASRLDGFQLSYSQTDFEFVLFDNYYIFGLNEAVSYMNKGAKATAIIPSGLAYGAYTINDVEPYTTLLYKIELVDIKPGIAVQPYGVSNLVKKKTNTGLEYYIVMEHAGDQVFAGNKIRVNYTGYSSDGRIFDSSVKKGSPMEIQIGVGNLIKGWDEGVLLMKEGEKFRLIIPPNLAYEGNYNVYPVINPNDTLTFDIELLEIL